MRLPALLLSALLALPAWGAGIEVENAWIREPVPGQAVAGGYLDLTSPQDASLVGAESPAAGIVELHEMRMQGGIMQMRPLKQVDLPKGKTVKLEPGGLHLMLIDLERPLKAGDKVPLTLKFRSGAKLESLQITAEVRAMNPGPAPHP